MATQAELPESMRQLARHQWVREHGTPRLTVLVGTARTARALWAEWLALSGRVSAAADLTELGRAGRAATQRIERAIEHAAAQPTRPSALIVSDGALAGLLADRDDRVSAMVREGIVPVATAPATENHGERAEGSRRARAADRARSLAELTLFEALEQMPATAGRFRLNQRLVAVRFGNADAEIDLLAPAERIAVEIDGFHHFGDAAHYRRDRRKDLLLQARGYMVLRVLAEDVHADTRAAVRMVCEALAYAGKRAKHEGSP